MTKELDGHLTQSVLKALDVLECLQNERNALAPAEIARKIGVSRPTAYRLLATMANRGWVSKDSHDASKYRLGYRVLQLAGVFLSDLDIRSIAHPVMEQLSHQYDESVRLFMLDGHDVVFIDQVLNTQPLQSFLPLGKRGALHSRAVGKAILAHMTMEQTDEVIQATGLDAVTAHTITDPDRLKQELERVRRLGYGVSDQEDVENLRAVGAAILDLRGTPIAGLAISGLVSHMNEERMATLGQAVREAALQISYQLGYKPRKEV